MGIECDYSFKDLYFAAFGEAPTQDEMVEFLRLDQDVRNERVKLWAEKAGWGTDDRVGTDGPVYTAFCPLWK